MRTYACFACLCLLLGIKPAAAVETIKVSGKSAAEFTIAFRRTLRVDGETKPAPNGSVFDVIARPGSKLYFRMEEINPRKYTVKVTATTPETTELKLPQIWSDALKDVLKGLTSLGKPAAGANAPPTKRIEDMNFEELVQEFDRNASFISTLADLLDKADKLSNTEENYTDFRSKLTQLQEGKDLAAVVALPGLTPDWYTEDTLDKIFTAAKERVEALSDVLANMRRKATSQTEKFAVQRAQAIYKNAVALGDRLDEAKKTLKTYLDPVQGAELFKTPAETVDFKSGKLTVKVQVSEKADKESKVLYLVVFEVRSIEKNFFEVSTGVAFSNIHSGSYTLVQKTEDGVVVNRIARKGAEDSWESNFSAMIHYGWTLSESWSVAISLGLSQSDSKYQFYVGPSFALGAERRIYLSGGWALASVDRLKGYNTGDPFVGKADDIPTKSVTRTGYFFGASYRF